MKLHHLILAFQFLTRLPMPALKDVEGRDHARSSIYFPLVGLFIGAFLAALMWACWSNGNWFAAAVVLAGWIWITGALHLDGLGDVADALGASHSKPERFFEVLKDPHAGNFAVVAIALLLIVKLVLIAHIPASGWSWPLVLVPAWARWGSLVWGSMLPSLKQGLGQDFAQSISTSSIGVWALFLIAASYMFAPALLLIVLVVPALGFYWLWRLGGITGDCHGASIEITETLLLAAIVLTN